MKNFKKYFKMLITAVICFAMCFVSGKNVTADVEKVLADGQAVPNHTEKDRVLTKSTSTVFKNSQIAEKEKNKYREGSFLKKIFFWLKGPGDRSGEILPRGFLYASRPVISCSFAIEGLL